MKRNYIFVVAFIFFGVITGNAAAHHERKDISIVLGYLEGSTVQLGSVLYDEQCASCHGQNLEGQPNWHKRDQDGYLPAPPHDETGHTWHHTDKDLFEMTKYGIRAFAGEGYKTRMPIYKDILSDSEILAVLSFIKSGWPTEVIQIHNEQVNSSK
jgi:mono/diheme cytochrome c family protein